MKNYIFLVICTVVSAMLFGACLCFSICDHDTLLTVGAVFSGIDTVAAVGALLFTRWQELPPKDSTEF